MFPGVDLMATEDVRNSIATFGDRYLRRVYTDHELSHCSHFPEPARSEHLAGRFAAKEAVYKAIRHPRSAMAWTDIEILADPEGWPEVRLHGSARRHADSQGIREVRVSISHHSSMALAMATAGA